MVFSVQQEQRGGGSAAGRGLRRAAAGNSRFSRSEAMRHGPRVLTWGVCVMEQPSGVSILHSCWVTVLL